MDASSFILFVMFFIAPPTSASNRPWALQSTQTAEFGSWTACNDAISLHLLPAAKTTATVSVFGWCMPKDADKANIEGRNSLIENHAVGKTPPTEDELQKYGTCYYYAPGGPNGDAKLLGECKPDEQPPSKTKRRK